MQTWTQQPAGNAALDAGRTVDAAHARNGDAARVLIVDDDASVRLVCAVNLEAEGLHVLEAADGLDAPEQARRERADLILTDVSMPRLGGFRLAGRLRVGDLGRGRRWELRGAGSRRHEFVRDERGERRRPDLAAQKDHRNTAGFRRRRTHAGRIAPTAEIAAHGTCRAAQRTAA